MELTFPFVNEVSVCKLFTKFMNYPLLYLQHSLIIYFLLACVA